VHWQFSSERVYSLLANHIQEPAALARLSKSVSHANAVRCRKTSQNFENTDILTTTTNTMASNDKEYDAIIDILANKAIETTLTAHEELLAEEQVLRDRWNNRLENLVISQID
jgi:hypothetical protein